MSNKKQQKQIIEALIENQLAILDDAKELLVSVNQASNLEALTHTIFDIYGAKTTKQIFQDAKAQTGVLFPKRGVYDYVISVQYEKIAMSPLPLQTIQWSQKYLKAIQENLNRYQIPDTIDKNEIEDAYEIDLPF